VSQPAAIRSTLSVIYMNVWIWREHWLKSPGYFNRRHKSCHYSSGT
jgi:hypothetical protein